MTKLNEIYKCAVCGNIVEVVHAGAGELVCCGQPMKRMDEGTSDGAAEKHVPVIEKIEGGYKVKVGSVDHPMIDTHYIEWIELVCEKCGKVQRKYLKPGDKPEAVFKSDSDKVIAREYCNLHGLWKAEN
ncbi:MAG: desulfoferrodoxin [Elusimicrobiales bacterium]|nr:desulfoferrodoxin [Elusimicrobiales bacterium]